ncbi:MAG: MFS transporter, partial [Muribaculaceae bacterium]|nr:MFS transporter [Muribaculaceae bacterium]
SDYFYLENPVQAVFSENNNYYLTDSSYKIIAANNKNELIYTVDGGNPDTSFDYADSFAADGGVLYVHDKSYTADGSYAYRERILKFTEDGKKREILYETETLDENGIQIIYLDSPRIIDGIFYFSEIAAEGIYVKKICGNKAEDVAFMPLENAYDIAADSSFSNEFEISAALMNGDIYTRKNGENILTYDASETRTEEYRSFAMETAYDSGGRLYFNDMGRRKIFAADEKGIYEIFEKISDGTSKELAKRPIYSGLIVSENAVSFLTSEYEYDQNADEPSYRYNIEALEPDGTQIFYGNKIKISLKRRITVFAVYFAILICVIIGIYSVIKIISVFGCVGAKRSGTQFIVLLTAVAATVAASYSLFKVCNERFMNTSSDKLANIAYLIEAKINKNTVKEINSPDKYFDADYSELNETISGILKSEINKNDNIYAVIYKVFDNIICEVYRSDMYHEIMYPMAGEYSGSIESRVAEEGKAYISENSALSEGSYSLALIPSYGEDGELLAFIEVGTDYNYFLRENNALYRKFLIASAMTVIVIMLLFSEFANGINAFKQKKSAEKTPPDVIRPIAFMIFFTANITTAFLPIYGKSLWDEDFPVPAEVAAAFPLSAELICSALSALICGFIIKKIGIKSMCVIGALFYIGGNILSAFSANLWILIAANSVCGIGGGLLTISVNTWITGFEDEANQNKGFVHYNAAFLAGMNCGTVIGSLLWESFGVTAAYFAAAFGGLCVIIFTILLMDKKRVISNNSNKIKKEKPLLRDFFTPSAIKMFVCVTIPYLICASFLSYYFPIVAEENLLSAAEISMAFLISGVISIYAGASIGERVTEILGVKKTMILASFIYAAALLYLAINPSIASCYTVIVFFAAADSFGLSAQSVYFAAMPEVKKIGASRALGINSTIESIASASGSVIFGGALLMGEQKGILLIAAVFAGLLLLYVIGGRKNENA